MPADFYPFATRRVLEESDGINSDTTFDVKTEAFGKSPSDVSPYLIANEWIAANIAWFLRLPIPPFSLLRKKTRATTMFASYSFEGDSKPKNCNPAEVFKAYPKICAGVVVFDILVGNFDRHYRNIKVDRPLSPRWMRIIDHERCLFHVYPKEGIRRLRDIEGRLGITDGSHSGNEWHCLIQHLESVEDIKDWVFRASQIPDWFIEAICWDVWKISINKKEYETVIAFLKRRRDKLGELILDHKTRFDSIPFANWPLIL
jgi:hypothetical protein